MTSQQPPEGLSAENRELADAVFGDDLPYTDRHGMIISESLLNALLNAARSTSPAPDPKAGREDQIEQGIACLRMAMRATDLGTAQAMMQAALDFLTNDQEALAEGRLWADPEDGE